MFITFKRFILIDESVTNETLTNLLRIDYKEISQNIQTFISDSVNKSCVDGVIIGLSGGLDSTVIAYLTAKALPKEKILFMSLPDHQITPKIDIDDAKIVSDDLGIKLISIDITDIHNIFSKNLKKNRFAEGNLIARIRMSLLYYMSNLENRIVIGTSDRSELLMGYFTKHGDGGSDILPIGGLYKTQVRELGKYLKIPETILEKKSSPHLWKNQTAEEEMGLQYETIDTVLNLTIDRNYPFDDVVNIIGDSSVVKKIIDMNMKSQHKRESTLICNILQPTGNIT